MNLINQWWFQLYTRKLLLSFVKLLAIGLTADILVTKFGGPFRIFSVFLIGVYPFFLLVMSTHASFRSNLEFHKMSVPFKSLKKAFHFHIIISVLSVLFFCGIHILLSTMFGGIYKFFFHQKSGFNIYGYQIFIGFVVSLIFLTYAMCWSKDRRYMLYNPSTNFFQKIKNFLFYSVLGVAYLILVSVFNLGEAFVIWVPIVSVFVGMLFFYNRAFFHQYRPVGTKLDLIKFWSLGYAVCFALYFISAQSAKTVLEDGSLSGFDRAVAFSYMGSFSPEIDEQTYFAIEKSVDHMDEELLLSKINFPLSQLGFRYFVNGGNIKYSKLLHVLKNEKVGKKFLVDLYDHYEMNPDHWNKSYYGRYLVYQSFLKWPKDHKLPERFIVARQKSSELLKSKKPDMLEESLNRAMASEK